MSTLADTAPVSKPALWLGRILSGLVILFLLFDGAIKLVPWPVVTETMDRIGYGSSETSGAQPRRSSPSSAPLLYAVPPTSILGAILLTGYLGGAMASHVRIGSPLFSHILFGFYLGLMVWGGLWLRDRSLRALMPLSTLICLTDISQSTEPPMFEIIAIIAVVLAIAIAAVLILAATKPDYVQRPACDQRSRRRRKGSFR